MRKGRRERQEIRRFGWACGLILSLCPAPAAGAAHPIGKAPPCRSDAGGSVASICARTERRLELLLIDAADLSEEVQAALRDEVAALFADAGVEVIFPSLAAPPSSSPSTTKRLKIVVLGEDGERFGVDGAHMGANLIEPGRESDTAYVFMPVVRKALDSRPLPVEALTGARIGRALGRVVAHEAVHALAPGLSHARTGIMKPTPNLRDLLAATAQLDEDSIAALRNAFSPGG